ncbi:MAG: Ni/Fe hydrogenase subunit gamma [Calditrichaeota bacterium]|nr:MAG: Ni/Fe hydrogenase subunit gamma [Calditrichota bacterium]
MSNHNGNPMLPESFSVKRIKNETDDTFTVELQPSKKVLDLSFEAGQFNMLYIFGVGEIPISISGDPCSTDSLVHTTRVVGTVTKAMRKLHVGDLIGVRGPFGNPWPVEEAKGKDVVLIAGGIGLAPIRPVINYIISNRNKFENVVVLYGTRTPKDILYAKEIKFWEKKHRIQTFVTVDRAIGEWEGNVGVVTKLVARTPFDPKNAIAMACGPEVMMRFTVRELQKRGIANSSIYVSTERNMKCGIGHCGHCQFGAEFVCKDGPVFRYDKIAHLFDVWEV